jgi:hypothetical protein
MANRPRSLADLLRLHAEKGNEDINLTADEERRLREALDNWVSIAQPWAQVFGLRARRAFSQSLTRRLLSCGRVI